jgi:5-hydroxyisourate hydrolase-like protein (transthyretin family)
MRKTVLIILAIVTVVFANIATQKTGTSPLFRSGNSYSRLGAGGPDAYGYIWCDNDTTSVLAPTFNWIDISSGGTLVTGLGDDNVVGPYNIGFDFPYYWYRVSSFYIGSNGYIAFGDNTMAAATFENPFPHPDRPNNTVAPLMSDFDFTAGSPSCYVWTNSANDTCVITYQNLRWWNQPTSNCSLQIILSRPDSSITFQFKRIVGYDAYAGAAEGNVTGIENSLGNDGLTYLFNQIQTQNALHDELAVKFYPPTTTTYEAYDISIWNAMSDNSGGFFLLNSTATPLWANVINSGNQPVSPCSVFCRIENDTGVVVFSDTVEIASMSVGQRDSVVFANWTPSEIGTYNTIFRAKIGTDILLSNDSVVIETQVVNYPTELAFDDGDYNAGTSWQGINNGYGMKFYPPTYPCRIVGAKAMLALAGATPTSCTMFVFQADGPNGGPGTVLGYRHINISSATPKWYYLQMDQTISAGAFFVGVISRADTGEPYFWMDEDPPISRQTWEYTSGWSPSRDLSTRDVMMRAIIGYEPVDDDFSVDEIIAPTGVLTPGAAITPQAMIRNWGLDNQSNVGVVMKIDSAGNNIYTGTATISLDAGSEDIATFSPQYIAGPAPNTYDIRTYTTLTGDENPANDTMYGMAASFVASNYMYANFRAITPTIDGNIELLEWADAIKNDVSNVLGHSDGHPKRTGSAYCWVKHDSEYVYIAGSMPNAGAVDLGDQLGIYIDEDRNSQWNADTSEGNYWASYRTGTDSTLAFRPIITGGTVVNTHRVYWGEPMAKGALNNGYVNIECKIPKGTNREYLNINAVFDTVRFWFFALDYDYDNENWNGWWKTTMTNGDAFNPGAYGILFFRGQYFDVGVDEIIEPNGPVPYTGSSITPKVVVTNYGLATGSFPVILTITPVKAKQEPYYDTVYISLGLAQSQTVEFDPFPAELGSYTVEAKVEMTGDQSATNNILTTSCEIALGAWTQLTGMPTNNSPKLVKDGGAIIATNSAVYGFKGWKSRAFYKFDGTNWSDMETIPNGLKYKPTRPIDSLKFNKKGPGKGASLAWDGGNTIYAIKGNGLWEFWAYDIGANTWTSKAWIGGDKGAKAGSAIAYADGKVYMLLSKQKATGFFFVYDVGTDAWSELTSPTLGPNNKKWKDGTDLIAYGTGTLLALKGGDKYCPFWSYDIGTGVWTEIESIPLINPILDKKIKVADGGSIISDGLIVYAIKGGGKQDFWRYAPGTPGVWTADTVPMGPLGKKGLPKTGAGLAYLDNFVYMLNGNKTDEFWKYGPVGSKADFVARVARTETAIMGDAIEVLKFDLSVSPNPLTHGTMIRYTVPAAGNVTLKLYNTAGRLIETLHSGYTNSGHYTTTIGNISSGVYFLKYEDGTNYKNIKLIVQ